jgi:hypothetical protein
VRFDGFAGNAGVFLLGITDFAGSIHLLFGESKRFKCGFGKVHIWDLTSVPISSAAFFGAVAGNFPTFLRRVVFVRQPALRFGFNDQGVNLDLPGVEDLLAGKTEFFHGWIKISIGYLDI